MTHEQFIEKETAKLAKQAGFDWNVGAYFLNGYFYRANFYANYNLRILADYKTISAPTQAVLQRWLREVKGIYLHIAFDKAENGWYTYIPDTDEYSKTYSTFEEALEVALQECLTLIIENNETLQINR